MHNGNTSRRRKKGTKEIFVAIMTENFPKLMSDTKLQIQKVQRTSNRISAKKTTHRSIVSNYRKSVIKKKILKEAKGEKLLPKEKQRKGLHLISP